MTTTKLSVAAVLLFAVGMTANSRALSAESAPVDAFGDPLPPGALARMGTVRFRHSSNLVCAVAYSPDGKLLASGSAHGELRLWDAATGKLVWALEDRLGVVTHTIAFSPDGELLASNKEGMLGLWQASTGKKLRDLECGNTGWAGSAAFSPDGKELALGTDNDPAIRIFDPATGKLSRKIAGHEKAAVVVVYSKDGQLIASGSKDKTARIWDAATGKELHRFQEPEEVEDVALSPDRKLLATKTHKTVWLWDVASGKEVHRFEHGSMDLRTLAFSPDGKVLGSDGVLWDAATGKQICQCEGEPWGDMAFSPDGKTIASGGWKGVVFLFDSATGKELPISRAGWNRGAQNAVGFTPDGKGLVLHSTNGHGLSLCESATGKEIRKYATDGEAPLTVVMSPDGIMLAASTYYGTLFLWEAATGKSLYRLKGPEGQVNGGRAWAFAFAPDSGTFAVSEGENVIRLRDAATRKQLQQFRGHDGVIRSLCFMPDGKTLVSTGDDETTCFWDTANGKEQKAHLMLTGSVQALSPDGRLAAVVEFKGGQVFHIQEVATGKEVRRFPVIYPLYCAFSPDGKTLAVYANGDYVPDTARPILLLEVATGKARMKLAGHRGRELGSMAFSPDGRMLASGSSDKTALVWDATGRMRERRFETAVLSPKELHDSWAALAGDDAAKAYQAIWALTASPEQTLPLLKEHLRPLPAADAKETARRLADLDSDDFAVREKAEKELGEQGDLVEPALRKTLDERPSSEVRQRVERLLQNLTSPRGLQRFRALEVLERIGTSEAEKVLKEAARGAPEARLTREAKASLERLSRRPAP
jgi:WD40 repeat protein